MDAKKKANIIGVGLGTMGILVGVFLANAKRPTAGKYVLYSAMGLAIAGLMYYPIRKIALEPKQDNLIASN